MRVLLFLFSLCLAAFSAAQSFPPPAGSTSVSADHTAALPVPIQGTLENGLRYTLLPLKTQPQRVDVLMRVYAGALDETPAQSGGAHMVEHMAFRASADFPLGVMPFLHEQGWLRGKNYNAFTGQENTTYIYMPPTAFGLKQTLNVVRQMLFKAKMQPSDWDDERRIVLEEWRSRDSVRRRLYEQRQSSSRAGSRYENRPVIGTEQSIRTMPVSELQRYYQTWYVPNNMQLLLVGDFDIKNAENLIRIFFADLPHQALPQRDDRYYEPQLTGNIRVDKLSDPQNTNSQISYLWRFDDHQSQAQTDDGFAQRLLDKLAVDALNQRMRARQDKLLPVSPLTIRKIPVGKYTSALSFSGNVEKQSHAVAAKFLLEQAERLKRFPVTQAEWTQLKDTALAQLDSDKNAQQHFTFEEWVQHMVGTLLNDKTYYPPDQIERLTKQTLERLTVADINARIRYWLDAPDQILQYLPPLSVETPPISVDHVEQWQKALAARSFTADKTDNTATFALPPLTTQGNIVQEQRFPEQNVVRWQLSNGDTVVWLQSDTAKNKTYFVAQSGAGSNAENVVNWQGKLAIELIGKNAPLNFTFNQLQTWKEKHRIPLVTRQSFDKLTILSTVENDKFADLLRFYYAAQRETRIKEEFVNVKLNYVRRLALQPDSMDFKRNLAWETFVYGHAINPQPSLQDAKRVSQKQLAAQWTAITSAPVTFFVMNNLPEAEVKAAVERHLAGIKRGNAVQTAPLTVLAGRAENQFATNAEPKDNVYLSMFQAYPWNAKDELAVALTSQIASEKLSRKLRDENLGIYSKRFKSRLQAETGRIQTTLTFSADPVRTAMLLDTATQVLKTLPHTITQDDLQIAKNYYYQQLDSTANTPDAKLERLIHSENRLQNPTLLNNERAIIDSLTLQDIQRLAPYLYSEENQRLFITTPQAPQTP